MLYTVTRAGNCIKKGHLILGYGAKTAKNGNKVDIRLSNKKTDRTK
jgi:hypothetical protein